jgi:hypothetical protein
MKSEKKFALKNQELKEKTLSKFETYKKRYSIFFRFVFIDSQTFCSVSFHKPCFQHMLDKPNMNTSLS